MTTHPGFGRLLWSCVMALLAIALPASDAHLHAAEKSPAAEASSVPQDEVTSDAIKAWQDKRFGMFIHWGPVALKGTEIGWSRGKEVPAEEYDQLYKQFNPTEFDAVAWAKIAKAAGMKYLVLTTKHHDGFCLWPSKYDDYNISATPFKRDVVGELAAACRAEGIQFCAYYSLPDWRGIDYPLASPGGSVKSETPNMPRHYQLIKDQTKELIDNYGPLGLMWFDGDWEEPWTLEYGNGLYDYLKAIQPDLIINNRVSKTRISPEEQAARGLHIAGDYDTPEQRIGGFDRDMPWETCMTICEQWAWKPHDHLKPLKQCLQSLIQTAGGDGNFLFNVGPMPDGRIEPRQVERLEEMGAWLAKYGDGIYATRGGPFMPGDWGASTCKGNSLYLFVMNWPDVGPLRLPAISRTITASKIRSGGQAVVTQTRDGVEIDVPPADRAEIATVIELTLDGPALSVTPVAVRLRSGSLACHQQATASNVFQNESDYDASRAFDDDSKTRWATDGNVHSAWLQVDFARPTIISQAKIDEPEQLQRVEKFELQYDDGDGWKTFHRGSTIGPQRTIKFAPITARRVRLQILTASDGPTINEFRLFSPQTAATSPSS